MYQLEIKSLGVKSDKELLQDLNNIEESGYKVEHIIFVGTQNNMRLYEVICRRI